MEVLTRIPEVLFANELTTFFSIFLCAMFVFFLIAHSRQQSAGFSSITRSAGSTLVSVGVLGTFVGIFIGLQHFDPHEIDKSIPPLLNGLKVAFVTSILGMSLAVLFRFYQAAVPVATDAGATPEDIARVLGEIRDDARNSAAQQSQSMAALQSAIAGEGETTLVTQLQKIRTTFGDQLEELRLESKESSNRLISEFQGFAKTMAENNSKALIEALNDVIRDFNQKLTEQFGENFKELNAAVGLLVQWQDNYKAQVEQMSEEFARSLQGIEQASAALSEIASSTSTIPPVVEGLGSIVETMATQIPVLAAHLEGLADLRDKAVEAFPVIQKNLDDLTTEFSKAVTDSTDEVKRTSTQLRQTFETATSDTCNALGQQIQILENQMQQQLVGAIEQMGGHLASLSNKFVEDYTPLTDKLKRLVELAP